MVTFKVLLCVFVVFNLLDSALTHNMRRCVDCVSIRTCHSALTFARKPDNGIPPNEKRDILLNSLCGFDANRMPKVCCSDFLLVNTETGTESPVSAGSIEMHRNFDLLPSSCGDIAYTRIMYGLIERVNEVPWMALIAYNTDEGVQFGCAGSIINSRYILTAAHCVIHNGAFKNIAGVRIGDLDNTEVVCQGHGANMMCETRIQDIDVQEIIPHENFNERLPITADLLALLRLGEPIIMNNNAAPICLPVYEELRAVNLTDRSATVAGWGATENQTDSSRLMKEQITIKSGDTSKSYYTEYSYIRQRHFEKAFCACVKALQPCSCIGDSGGPLMVASDVNGPMRFVQYGIVALGHGSRYPGVYTDVSKYMSWILDHIKE